MADTTLYVILALSFVGLIGLALAPRDKIKKYKQRRDVYEGLDDFALLIRLTEEGNFRRFSKTLRKVIREERNPERRRVLRGVEGEVLKWLKKQ